MIGFHGIRTDMYDRHFWKRRYYCEMTGDVNEIAIKKNIKEQCQKNWWEDISENEQRWEPFLCDQ